jgi:AraC-like DNA-binding protein
MDQIRRVAERKGASSNILKEKALDLVEWDESLRWCRQQLVRALSSMEERDRVALLLRFSSGWAANAIAAFLNVSPGHISRILRQATGHLRLQLEDPLKQMFEEYDQSTIAQLLFRGLEDVQPEALHVEADALINAQETIVGKIQHKSRKKNELKKPEKIIVQYVAGKPIGAGKHIPASKPARRKVPTPPAADSQHDSEIERLKQFLPEKVVEVQINEAPEDFFARIEREPSDQRPAVICLDARKERDLRRVLRWLERFDAVASEQFEDDAENPFEPHRVVIVSTQVSEPPADWRSRLDVDWVPTDDLSSSVLNLYRQDLLDDLRAFVEEDLTGFFPTVPVGKSRRLVDDLPASKRAAWKARVSAFEVREDEV